MIPKKVKKGQGIREKKDAANLGKGMIQGKWKIRQGIYTPRPHGK